MNSKLWISKALSMCLVIATILTYSMVTLASSERIAGEILVTGNNANGQTPFVKVNGEAAQSGRSIFSSSTIATAENAGAIINLGKLGKIELAPNTTLSLSFNEKSISGNLATGRLTVLNAAENVVVNTVNGQSVALTTGETVSANTAQDDTTNDNNGGSAGLLYALILGGAAVGIIFAATRGNDNNITLGGGSTVISPTR